MNMEHKKLFDNFTNQYQLSKTLRFELVPQGETEKFIKEKGLLKQDEDRADDYKKVKKLIDEYHKKFINKALTGLRLEGLEEYKKLYEKKDKDDNDKKKLEDLQTFLREKIVVRFTGKLKNKTIDKDAADRYSRLLSKELIKEDLLCFVQEKGQYALMEERLKKAGIPSSEVCISLINEFKDFTTYFTGFHQNRENIYTSEAKATAIAYRLIHDNLPRFIDNLRVYEFITNNYSDLDLRVIETDLKEVLQEATVKEIFSMEYFNETLTQKSIEKYNIAIGGRSVEGQRKLKGLNEHVNEYKPKEGEKKPPKFKELWKQILSEKESVSFIPEAFQDDKELLQSIRQFYEKELLKWEKEGNSKSVIQEVERLMKGISTFERDAIFLRNDTLLTGISNKIFGDWVVIRRALAEKYKADNPIKKRENEANYEDRAREWAEKIPHFSIAEIETALNVYKSINADEEIKRKITQHTLCDYFAEMKTKKEGEQAVKSILQQIEKSYWAVTPILENSAKKPLNQSKEKDGAVEKIKNFLDSVKDLLHFIKPLYPGDISGEKEEGFYSAYITLYDQLNLITPLYNKTRNYLTKKPYSTEKIKLNFENKGDFLGGWVDSYTESSDNATQSGGYLFRKKNPIGEYDYFLGISNDKKLFRCYLQDEVKDKSVYERLDYYQLKTASVYGNSYIGKNSYDKDKKRLIKAISNFVKRQNNELFSELKKYLKKDTSTPNGCFKLIRENHPDSFERLINSKDFLAINNEVIENLKKTLDTLSRVQGAKKYASNKYKLFSEVITDIEQLAKEKNYSYFPVSQDELNEALNRTEKPLLLFKITNKDLSFAEKYTEGKRKSRGNENMHTLYFRHLMSGNQNVFDIGTGEVFFRDETKDLKYTTAVHEEGKPIENKNPNVCRYKPTSVFDYKIIKNKRFTKRKYLLHLSLTLNYQEPKRPKKFNESVLQHLQNNPSTHIIGIDRGERHLLYLTLIDQEGNIKKQLSLNEIISWYKNAEGKTIEVKTPYHEKLDKKEKERDEARKSWGTIENIKELKEGYLSQVVHQIAKMMVEYNAIVVLEDLNMGFKRGRQKVEKQVYQKFEMMLIDKLNYLAFKNPDPGEPGILNALQLTERYSDFMKYNKKQCGFLLFVPPHYTSKIDPVSGFVNFMDSQYESVEKSKEFFSKFKSIRFNPEKQWFEFTFDYNDFTTKAKGTRTDWTVCTTPKTRYVWNKKLNNGRGAQEPICVRKGCEAGNITRQLEDLFRDNISYDGGNNIIPELLKQASGKKEVASKYFKDLTKLLSATLTLRHNNGEKGEKEIDFILSPVVDKGTYFYSENIKQIPEKERKLPQDADANGAYHIALKGLLMLKRIKGDKNVEKLDKNGNLDLSISNKEWLNFVQEKIFRK